MAISEARHRANEKYNAKAYDEIKLRVAKGRKETIRTVAEFCGESTNSFINRLIDAELERLEREQHAGAGSGFQKGAADSE